MLRVVVDGGHNREDKGSNTGGRQDRSADRSPAPGVPVPVPACRSNDGQEGIDRGEESQRYLHLHSDTSLAAGSGSSHKGNEAAGVQVGRVDPSLSIPSCTLSGQSDGA